MKIKITMGRIFHIQGFGTPGVNEITIEGEVKTDIDQKEIQEILSRVQSIINESTNIIIKIEEVPEPKTKFFVLHWRDGSINTVQGPTVESAFTSAGFGHGAVPALDYYEEVVGPEVVENILKEIEEK